MATWNCERCGDHGLAAEVVGRLVMDPQRCPRCANPDLRLADRPQAEHPGQRLRDAIILATGTFLEYAERREIRVPPGFWLALGGLNWAARFAANVDLAAAVMDHHRRLGTPADFGEGTPCAQALAEILAAYNALAKELSLKTKRAYRSPIGANRPDLGEVE